MARAYGSSPADSYSAAYGWKQGDWTSDGGVVDSAGREVDRFRGMGAPTRGEMQVNREQATKDYGLAQESRGKQDQAMGLMRAAAEGNAPSAAQIQMRQGIDQGITSQMAMANSARGGGSAMAGARRQAAFQGAQAQQQGAMAGSALRAQEMAQARGAYGEMTNAQRANDISLRGQSIQEAVASGQLQLGSREANDRRQMYFEGLGHAINQGEAERRLEGQKMQAGVQSAHEAASAQWDAALLGMATSIGGGMVGHSGADQKQDFQPQTDGAGGNWGMVGLMGSGMGMKDEFAPQTLTAGDNTFGQLPESSPGTNQDVTAPQAGGESNPMVAGGANTAPSYSEGATPAAIAQAKTEKSQVAAGIKGQLANKQVTPAPSNLYMPLADEQAMYAQDAAAKAEAAKKAQAGETTTGDDIRNMAGVGLAGLGAYAALRSKPRPVAYQPTPRFRYPDAPQIPSDPELKTDVQKQNTADNLLTSFAKSASTYRYKDPANEPSTQPNGGRYLGILADEVQKTPEVGNQIIKDTPQGKMVEQGAMTSALAAGEGRLHERLENVENQNSMLMHMLRRKAG